MSNQQYSIYMKRLQFLVLFLVFAFFILWNLRSDAHVELHVHSTGEMERLNDTVRENDRNERNRQSFERLNTENERAKDRSQAYEYIRDNYI